MNKPLLLILALTVLLGAGCVWRDTPSFADGEATALVMDRSAELDSAGVSLASARALLHRCLEIAFAGGLREEYLGKGVWRVYPTGETWSREWRVYETSRTVSPCFVPDSGD